jgi:hypothetical protein
MGWRLALAGLLLAALAGGYGRWQHGVAVAERARADAAEAREVGLREAARVLDAHLQRVARDRDHWQAVAAELDEIGGGDEPLNDYGRAVLDRVRRAAP